MQKRSRPRARAQSWRLFPAPSSCDISVVSTMACETFEQDCPLTRRLQQLLHQYDAGTTLQELVQNADDAKATKVTFILDLRKHRSRSLIAPSMEVMQGPALLQYDDAIFLPENFAAIKHIGDGSKRFDPTSTGRFGLGFNSTYHLTDTPQVGTTTDEQHATCAVRCDASVLTARHRLCTFTRLTFIPPPHLCRAYPC